VTADPALFEQHMVGEHGKKSRTASAGRATTWRTPNRVPEAKAQAAAGMVTVAGLVDGELLAQVVGPAAWPRTSWVIPATPTGREFQGCLLVRTEGDRLVEVNHDHLVNRRAA
jgi:hypothetical protein